MEHSAQINPAKPLWSTWVVDIDVSAATVSWVRVFDMNWIGAIQGMLLGIFTPKLFEEANVNSPSEIGLLEIYWVSSQN